MTTARLQKQIAAANAKRKAAEAAAAEAVIAQRAAAIAALAACTAGINLPDNATEAECAAAAAKGEAAARAYEAARLLAQELKIKAANA